MNNLSIAPCGVICDLCIGFQRSKNQCAGCNQKGEKRHRCTVCSIKFCDEKKGPPESFCFECEKFPCRRLKNLDKRYTTKYGESPIENLNKIDSIGKDAFLAHEKAKWTCASCGQLLCVHRGVCIICGANNVYFPISN